MQTDVPIGTPIEHNDEVFGTVERVEHDGAGRVTAYVVRGGRQQSLLRVDARYLKPDGEGSLQLDPSVQLSSLEEEAVNSGKLPPLGEHFQDAGPTEPSPSPEQILGSESGLPPEYDGPATG